MLSTIGFQLLRSRTSEHMTRAGYEREVPVLVIDEVAKTRRVDDGKSELDTILFDVCR